jgi:hypothetical protein
MFLNHLVPLAQQNTVNGGGFDALTLFVLLIELSLVVFVIAGLWKTFVKAGQPGWAAIIPIYNLYIMIQIAGKPWWWLLLCFIPLVNIVFIILIHIEVAKNFGKGVGFGIGLAFLGFIFYPILGFGGAQYLARPEPRGFAVIQR